LERLFEIRHRLSQALVLGGALLNQAAGVKNRTVIAASERFPDVSQRPAG
jgi:hypothetical protein